MWAFLRRAFNGIRNRLPVEIRRRRPARGAHHEDNCRFVYQRRHVDFGIRPGERVLDVGSGQMPFPLATVLADRFLDQNVHRRGELVRDRRPLVVLDVGALPFADKSFDFVYCSHLLEHVDDPEKACSELMRVGRRGYIETPTFGKDLLFNWTQEMHRWHVVAHGNELHFFEYTERQRRGTGSDAWRKVIFGGARDPLQDLFRDNQDLFNVMFPWRDRFECFVHRLGGTGGGRGS